ncbi:MAG: class D sortase [Gemmatimonadaceae bacterium]|nr:class D sortase [Gemmatimonadaceae bacterium]
MATGLLLVTFAGTRYVEGAVRAEAVREQWEAAQVRAAVEATRNGVFTSVAAGGFTPGSPLARLRIPSIGLDEIVVAGVGDVELNVGPGHLPGSALPGQPGNSVISGHRDRHFLRLGGLALGDTVVTEMGPRRTQWIVVSRRVLGAGEPALFATVDATLTLTTCWPIRFFGPAPDRLVVTAKPLEPPAAGVQG